MLVNRYNGKKVLYSLSLIGFGYYSTQMCGMMYLLLVTTVVCAYLSLCVPRAFTNLDEESAYECSKPLNVCCMATNESTVYH